MFKSMLVGLLIASAPAFAGFKDIVEDAVGYCQKSVLDHVENQRKHGIEVPAVDAVNLISECIVDQIPEDRDPNCHGSNDYRCWN